MIIENSPVVTISNSTFEEFGVSVDMKRDDLIHPIISGNKWRKLKYLLQDAKGNDCQTIISMGGNWSNHLHALAFAGKEFDFQTIGCVRAHKEQPLTTTLQDCIAWGMELKFCNRVEYAKLREYKKHQHFLEEYPHSYWISEGGFSRLAIKGVADIQQEIHQHYDYIFVGTGSGATLIGLAQAFPESQIVGVAAFKGAEYLQKELSQGFPTLKNWQLATEYHRGGVAKKDLQVDAALLQFEIDNGFGLDKVYNTKVLLALIDWVKLGKLKKGEKVLMINTGGVQGNRC